MTTKPKLELAADNPLEQGAPDPFDVEALRLSQDFEEMAGVRRLLTTVPVRKPHKQEWIWVHPDPDYHGTFAVIELKEDREYYLITPQIARELPDELTRVTIFTAINGSNVIFLWPVKLPAPDGRINEWHESARAAAELGMTQRIQVRANMALGAYETSVSSHQGPAFHPKWPDQPFKELLRIAFKNGRLISSLDHPVVKTLQGRA
jgi:hypothetical protein